MVTFNFSTTESVRKLQPTAIWTLILVFVFLGLVARVLGGDCLRPGDASARYLISLGTASQLSSIFQVAPWISVWPPVPFICSAIVLRVLSSVGIARHVSLVSSYQIASCAATALGVVLLAFSASRRRGWISAGIALFVTLTVIPVLMLSDQGMSECFALLFIGLAIAAGQRAFDTSRKAIPSILSAVFLLAACFSRSETVCLVLPLGLLFLCSSGVRWSIPPVLLPLTGIVAKFAASRAVLYAQEKDFLHAGNSYDRSGVMHSNTVSYIRMLAGSAKGYFLVSVVCTVLILVLVWRCPECGNQVTRANRTLRGMYSRYGMWLLSSLIYLVFFVCEIHNGTINTQARYMLWPLLFLAILASTLLADAFLEIRVITDPNIRRQSRVGLFLVAGVFGVMLAKPWVHEYAHIQGLSADARQVVGALNTVRHTAQPVIFDFAGWEEEQIAAYIANPGDFDQPKDTSSHSFLFTETSDPDAVRNEMKSMLSKADVLIVEAPGFRVDKLSLQDLLTNGCFYCLEKVLPNDGLGTQTPITSNPTFSVQIVRKPSNHTAAASTPDSVIRKYP